MIVWGFDQAGRTVDTTSPGPLSTLFEAPGYTPFGSPFPPSTATMSRRAGMKCRPLTAAVISLVIAAVGAFACVLLVGALGDPRGVESMDVRVSSPWHPKRDANTLEKYGLLLGLSVLLGITAIVYLGSAIDAVADETLLGEVV